MLDELFAAAVAGDDWVSGDRDVAEDSGLELG